MTELGIKIRDELGVLTDEEFCLAVGIEQSTAATWRCRGTGPDYVKVGARILYRRIDVIEWLEANRRLCNRTTGDDAGRSLSRRPGYRERG